MPAVDLPVPALKVYLVKFEAPVFAPLWPMQKFSLAHLARHVAMCDEVDGGEVARVWRDVAARLARTVLGERGVVGGVTLAEHDAMHKAWVAIIDTALPIEAKTAEVSA